MPIETRLILKVAAVGIFISICLGVGAALTLGDGGEYGPGITTSSIIFGVGFFVLNPVHFLLLVASQLKLPVWMYWPATVFIGIGWWLFVGKMVVITLKRRKNV